MPCGHDAIVSKRNEKTESLRSRVTTFGRVGHVRVERVGCQGSLCDILARTTERVFHSGARTWSPLAVPPARALSVMGAKSHDESCEHDAAGWIHTQSLLAMGTPVAPC